MDVHRLSTALRWVPFAVVGVELVLLVTGIVDFAQAAVVIVVLEVAVAAILVGEAVTLYQTYDRARLRGEPRGAAAAAALDAALPPIVAHLVKQELRMVGALAGVFSRSPCLPEGARAISTGASLRTLMKVIVAVSILELVVVGVLVEAFVSSAAIRWTVVVLSLYGLVWVVAFTSSLRRNVHVLTGEDLRLRFAMLADLRVPTRVVATARRDRQGGHKHLVDAGDGTLSLSVMGMTNLLVELSEPTEIDLGRRGVHTVTKVLLQADDPDEAVRTIRAAVAHDDAEREPLRSNAALQGGG